MRESIVVHALSKDGFRRMYVSDWPRSAYIAVSLFDDSDMTQRSDDEVTEVTIRVANGSATYRLGALVDGVYEAERILLPGEKEASDETE